MNLVAGHHGAALEVVGRLSSHNHQAVVGQLRNSLGAWVWAHAARRSKHTKGRSMPVMYNTHEQQHEHPSWSIVYMYIHTHIYTRTANQRKSQHETC